MVKGASAKPRVRATKWVCEEQQCEGWPTFAYDYLPAVTKDGATLAVVEERDGWGHVPDPGVRFLDATKATSVAFHPLARGERDITSYAAFAKRKTELEDLVAKANEALDARSWVTLLPVKDPPTFVDRGKGWEKLDGAVDDCKSCRFRTDWSVAAVTVSLISKAFAGGVAAPGALERASVTVDGRTVKTVTDMTSWRAKKGCAERILQLVGIRRDPNVAAFLETSGSTTHACDGKREPQEYRVLRW